MAADRELIKQQIKARMKDKHLLKLPDIKEMLELALQYNMPEVLEDIIIPLPNKFKENVEQNSLLGDFFQQLIVQRRPLFMLKMMQMGVQFSPELVLSSLRNNFLYISIDFDQDDMPSEDLVKTTIILRMLAKKLSLKIDLQEVVENDRTLLSLTLRHHNNTGVFLFTKEDVEEAILNEIIEKKDYSETNFIKYLNLAANHQLKNVFSELMRQLPENYDRTLNLNTPLANAFLMACNKYDQDFIEYMLSHGLILTTDIIKGAIANIFNTIANEVRKVPVDENILLFATFLINLAKKHQIPIDLNWHIGNGRTPLSLALQVQNQNQALSVFNELQDLHLDHLVQAIVNDCIVDPNLPDFDLKNEKEFPLIKAIKGKKYAEALALIKMGANINISTPTSSGGYTALMLLAIQEPSLQSLIVLEEMLKKATLDELLIKNKNGYTLLLLAAQYKEPLPFELILKHGGYNLAERALPTLMYLISSAAEPESPNITISKQMIEMLVKAGVPLNIPGLNGMTPLEYAAQSGLTDIVKLFLAAGGTSPNIDRLLLEAQAQRIQRAENVFLESQNSPALHDFRSLSEVIAANQSVEYIESYLRTHSLHDPKNKDNTPLKILQNELFLAVCKKNDKLCQCLIEWGADLWACRRYLEELSATSFLAYLDNLAQKIELNTKGTPSENQNLDKGDSKSLREVQFNHDSHDLKFQQTQLFFRKEESIITKESIPAELNISDAFQKSKRPEMIRAIYNGDEQCVIRLIQEGVNPNYAGDFLSRIEYIKVSQTMQFNFFGFSPLHLACREGNVKMFNLLLKLGAKLEPADHLAHNLFNRTLKEISDNNKTHAPLLHELIDREHMREQQLKLLKEAESQMVRNRTDLV